MGGNHLSLRCCCYASLLHSDGPNYTKSKGLHASAKRFNLECWELLIKSVRRIFWYLRGWFCKPMCNVFSIKSSHFSLSYSASCCSLSLSPSCMVFVHFLLFLLDYLKIWFTLLFSNLLFWIFWDSTYLLFIFICVNETCVYFLSFSRQQVHSKV